MNITNDSSKVNGLGLISDYMGSAEFEFGAIPKAFSSFKERVAVKGFRVHVVPGPVETEKYRKVTTPNLYVLTPNDRTEEEFKGMTDTLSKHFFPFPDFVGRTSKEHFDFNNRNDNNKLNFGLEINDQYMVFNEIDTLSFIQDYLTYGNVTDNNDVRMGDTISVYNPDEYTYTRCIVKGLPEDDNYLTFVKEDNPKGSKFRELKCFCIAKE
jgi:hypothetical protein